MAEWLRWARLDTKIPSALEQRGLWGAIWLEHGALIGCKLYLKNKTKQKLSAGNMSFGTEIQTQYAEVYTPSTHCDSLNLCFSVDLWPLRSIIDVSKEKEAIKWCTTRTMIKLLIKRNSLTADRKHHLSNAAFSKLISPKQPKKRLIASHHSTDLKAEQKSPITDSVLKPLAVGRLAHRLCQPDLSFAHLLFAW